MHKKITKVLTDNLPAGPVDIYDTKLSGLVLRVTAAGTATYRVRYARGKWEKLGRATGLYPDEARERARQILGDVAKGNDPQESRRKANASSLASYLRHVYQPWLETNRKDGVATAARLWRQFGAEFGSKKLTNLTPWVIEKWRTKRLKAGIAPTTINRDMNALKAALNRAVDWGYLDASPLARLKPTKTDNRPKVRYLNAYEAQRLRQALADREGRMRVERASANEWRQARGYLKMPDLHAVPFTDHIRPLVLLALNTGMRRGELFNLQWDDVELERGNLTVQGDGAKSGQTRHIPLNREAMDLLRDWQRSTGAYIGLVFFARDGGRLNNINSAWSGVIKRAGIEAFRFHDLRHTFASWLVMAGTDLYVVRDLLGHASITQTERYAHLAPAQKMAAVAALEAPKG